MQLGTYWMVCQYNNCQQMQCKYAQILALILNAIYYLLMFFYLFLITETKTLFEIQMVLAKTFNKTDKTIHTASSAIESSK